jgi:hypothetical protein
MNKPDVAPAAAPEPDALETVAPAAAPVKSLRSSKVRLELRVQTSRRVQIDELWAELNAEESGTKPVAAPAAAEDDKYVELKDVVDYAGESIE